jgi:hypothetical protein
MTVDGDLVEINTEVSADLSQGWFPVGESKPQIPPYKLETILAFNPESGAIFQQILPTFNQFANAKNENISSKVHTMLRPVDEIFKDTVSILTTYSYRDQKRFYPIRTINDNRITYPMNIIDKINSSLLFSSMALKSREALYATDKLI